MAFNVISRYYQLPLSLLQPCSGVFGNVLLFCEQTLTVSKTLIRIERYRMS